MISDNLTQRLAVIYARVSTPTQNPTNQLCELQDVARRMNWKVIEELVDHGISGAKGREERPAFERLIQLVRRQQVEVVMTWSIDRLGRSIQHLVSFMKEVQAANVDLFVSQQAVNTATPAGRMIFSIFSALGEYERELIRDRINAGLARARANGTKLGRPSVANHPTVIASVKMLREKGHSIHHIARELRIGVGTTQKILAA